MNAGYLCGAPNCPGQHVSKRELCKDWPASQNVEITCTCGPASGGEHERECPMRRHLLRNVGASQNGQSVKCIDTDDLLSWLVDTANESMPWIAERLMECHRRIGEREELHTMIREARAMAGTASAGWVEWNGRADKLVGDSK